VQQGIHDRFVEKFAAEVIKLKVGDGAEVGVVQGPLINGRAVEKVERHVQDAVSHGAKVVTGGKRHALGRTFYEPTVLTGVTTKMLVTREETFGPVASVYAFKDEDEVVALANATQYGLASYFYTKDLGRAFRVAEALEYGMVGINSAILGTEVAPFGGVKESGLGREGGRHGMDEFVEHKYLLVGGLG
jgi:succinate-semialdehyde dehydrogenase / glutarate-semialdehyde dehydrogenase